MIEHKKTGQKSAATDLTLTGNPSTGKQATKSVASILTSGPHFLIVSHDDRCPTLKTQNGLDCRCNAKVKLVDEGTFLAIVGGGHD